MTRDCPATFLDADSLDAGDLDWSTLHAVLPQLECHARTAPDQVAERIRGRKVVITNKVVLDAALLDGADRLSLVCVAATGTNNVDIEAARKRGITVCNIRDYATPSVVQHTLALILALRTRLPAWQDRVRNGEWSRSSHFCLLDPGIEELHGQTLGIIGHGTLGQAVARAAECLGLRVLISERPGSTTIRPGRLPFLVVLETADIISLHAPLTPETHHLFNRETLARMKPGALLINTARGALVEPQDLRAALVSGHLGGAGVDVLDPEPPRADHPLLADPPPNLIVTPHVAWASRAARQRLLDQLANVVRHWQAGTPINEVGIRT